jgi:DnaK suppressor protein
MTKPMKRTTPSGKTTSGDSSPPAKRPEPKPAPSRKGDPASKGKAPAGRVAPIAARAASAAVPAAPPPPPRKLPKGGPTKADLKVYREKLLALRRELLESSRDLEAEVLKGSGAVYSVDHMADNGSDNYEQDFSFQLLEGEAAQLAEIREALLKIDGKLTPAFGVCEPCAEEDRGLCPTCPWIPKARLLAMPHTRMCVQMKALDEKRANA